MLEKYKQFKKILKNPEDYYEKYSINDNPLFGNKLFFSDEYLDNSFEIEVSVLNEFKYELQELILKYKYLLGFLTSVENKLIQENKILDEEFFELNQYSTKGQSFLKMFNMPDYYNHVVDYKIVYQKNIKKLTDTFIKTKETLEPLNFYLQYVGDYSFFIVFDKEYDIRDIFLDFYNIITYSIFGVKSDDTMENIYSNITSEQKLFINTNKTKYKKIFVTGISNINSFLKEIKIFSYSETDIAEKNGYLVYMLENLKNIKEFIIVSDDTTELFMFDEKTYSKMIEVLTSNEQLCIEKYFNNQYKVDKNINIENKLTDSLYILEFFKKTENKSNELKIFAKENTE